MNDLLSLPRYQDPNRDLEKGNGEGDEGSLDKFFSRIEDVKEDMKFVEQIRKKLQDSNETSKTIHSANAMKDLRAKMDADILQVLKRVKIIKKKLEDLEKANETHRKLPGCGPGSSIDRTRVSVVRGLGKKLKDLMGEFQDLRSKMADEYKETVARRYFTITGEKADEEVVDNLIESGESETFLQKAIQEQGRGQIMDAISEIQERHDAVKDIEKNLLELHQLFLDMAALVEAQGHQLDNIENHVAQASSFVKRGTVQLQEARETQKSTRKWKCIVILILLLFLLAILLPVFLKNQQQQHRLPPPPPHQPPPPPHHHQ